MSRLLDNSEQFREPLISKNTFSPEDEYDAGHPNALADGDANGKGEVNGIVGNIDDIRQRNILQAKNLYNKNREYDASNA